MIDFKIQRILVGVKHMPEATPALRYAGLLARVFNAHITLLSVLRWQKDRHAAQRWMKSARELLPGLEVESQVRTSIRPGMELLTELDRGEHDMLILSAFGKSIFEAMASGSVARFMVTNINKPIVIVNGECEQLKNLLVCTGGREVSKRVVEYSASIAKTAGARLTLLHVVSPVPSMYAGLNEIEETLDELLQTDTPVAQHLRWGARYLDEQGLSAEVELRHGVVSNEILREATKEDYDLIVLGAHVVTSPLTELMMDNVPHQVIENAPCPVLII